MTISIARAWLYANWQYAGLVTALILLALVPIIAGSLSLALLVVYLSLPVYMLHQVEEHTGDRFRRFVNSQLGHGRDVLTSGAVVVINIGLVWIAFLVALYLARFVDLGLGLIPVYLVLVNAAIHVLSAAAVRAYNPGLVTSLVLFLPYGIWAMTVVAPHAMPIDQAIAILFAVAGHAAIVAVVLGRVRSPATPRFVIGK